MLVLYKDGLLLGGAFSLRKVNDESFDIALNACLLMRGSDVYRYCKHSATSWLIHVENITA
jgi:hypothetical protein